MGCYIGVSLGERTLQNVHDGGRKDSPFKEFPKELRFCNVLRKGLSRGALFADLYIPYEMTTDKIVGTGTSWV